MQQRELRALALSAFIAACNEAADAADACADACAQSGLIDRFRRCTAFASDCADMCRASARIVTRGQLEPHALKSVIRVCCELCEVFTAECRPFTSEAKCAAAHQAAAECANVCRRAISAV